MTDYGPRLGRRPFELALASALLLLALAYPGRALHAEGCRMHPLLERFFSIDSALLEADTIAEARIVANRLKRPLRECVVRQPVPAHREKCFLDVLFSEGGLAPQPHAASRPVHNTVSGALSTGRGSCAALVATVLALTDDLGHPLDAVLLREHVVLGASDPAVFFEMLEGGRALTEEDLRKHAPPPAGRPVRVDGWGYLPYYLDNLAARLAGAVRCEQADRLFRQAIDVAPRAPRIRYNYGTFLLLGQGRYEEAEVMLSRAIRSGWNDAAAYSNRGVARWKLGKLGAARRDFERALALDPANREAAANLHRLKQSGRESRTDTRGEERGMAGSLHCRPRLFEYHMRSPEGSGPGQNRVADPQPE